jgi:hypothetical protein
MKTLLVSRYHPLLVLLHWLLAALIVAMLGIGFYLAVAMSNADPQKIGILLVHMSAGMLVVALMAAFHPPPAHRATCQCDRRPCGARPHRADHALRLLCSGVPDGSDRICDGYCGRA